MKRTCRKGERQQGKLLTQDEVSARHEDVSVDDGSLAEEMAMQDETYGGIDHTALALKEFEDAIEEKVFDMLLVSRKIPYNS